MLKKMFANIFLLIFTGHVFRKFSTYCFFFVLQYSSLPFSMTYWMNIIIVINRKFMLGDGHMHKGIRA